MAFVSVQIEWRRGVNGDAGTYVFYPKPVLRRIPPGKRTAILTVPLADGVIVQNLSMSERYIELTGILFNKTNSWDDIETARNNMINGLGSGPGQLHLITAQRHIRYDGQLTTESIQFDMQPRSNYQEYTIKIIVPSGDEINVTDTVRTINSGAEIV